MKSGFIFFFFVFAKLIRLSKIQFQLVAACNFKFRCYHEISLTKKMYLGEERKKISFEKINGIQSSTE